MPNDSHAKDNWDRVHTLAAVVAPLATIFLGGVGLYFTNRYNRAVDHQKDQELQLVRLQTIEKFLPYFDKTEADKRAATIALFHLDVDLAKELVAQFPSTGTIDGAKTVALTGTENSSVAAVTSLNNLIKRGPSADVRAEATQQLTQLATAATASTPVQRQASDTLTTLLTAPGPSVARTPAAGEGQGENVLRVPDKATIRFETKDKIGSVLVARASVNGVQVVPSGQPVSHFELTVDKKQSPYVIRIVTVFTASTSGAGSLTISVNGAPQRELAVSGDAPFSTMVIDVM